MTTADSSKKPEKFAPAPKYPAQPAPDNQVRPDDPFGPGGDRHQQTDERSQTLTDEQGHPVANNQNTITAGLRGPALLQDQVFRDKLFHFDHERIPERVVHARGTGAHGIFETYESLSDITAADIFARAGEKTEVFVRFSTVAGNKGSFDLARDVRGFAVKFYTQEGNWDLVGNNIPVFFVQDAIKFPDLIHAVKEAPDRGFPQAQSAHDNFWDFVSLSPETTHTLIWAMSDRAIPRSFRTMEGFGVHSYRFVNAEGRAHFVKFHWKPLQGLQSVTWPEAVSINGADPDFHRRDLWDAIQAGDFPQWELGVQVFDDEFADSFDFDVLDATKIIPEELVPVRPIGRMTLNRAVDNHFDETEQVAFMTQNVVQGIDFSNDPLLQGRNFSYLDTQLKRLGSTNFTQIPVNAARAPIMNQHRDGHMQTTVHTGRASYEPNSWSGEDKGPRENPSLGYQPLPEQVSGTNHRARAESFADHYSQPYQFWISQTPVEQQHIVDAFTFELSKCEVPQIRTRMLGNLRNVDEDLAQRVATGLGMELPEKAATQVEPRKDLDPSDALSILKNGPASFKGRKLGLLVSDGADAAQLAALVDAVTGVGGQVEVITPKIGGVTLSDGSKQPGGQFVKGVKAALYDAVALLVTEDGATELAQVPEARDFVTEAHANFKIIGLTEAGQLLADAVGVTPDAGWVPLADATAAAEAFGRLRHWERDVAANPATADVPADAADPKPQPGAGKKPKK
ncbi:catalase [Luteococcus peritonei]|uniref:Catalase n=1 Tax=Luteococcus peritonei TaxID=88874 RepID=A0ABW4RV56_9ACTN